MTHAPDVRAAEVSSMVTAAVHLMAATVAVSSAAAATAPMTAAALRKRISAGGEYGCQNDNDGEFQVALRHGTLPVRCGLSVNLEERQPGGMVPGEPDHAPAAGTSRANMVGTISRWNGMIVAR
jgi:hypothetical protein